MEEANSGKKDEAAQLKNEEKNDGKEDQSGEPKEESMTQQTTVALDEGQASVTSGSYMVKCDPLGQTANPLTDDMSEALIELRTNKAKQYIQVLFQKLSEHVQVSETEKEGFQKVVLALIRYTVNNTNHDVQVLVVRRMQEDIFEAICKPGVWKTKCCWPSKQLPVQTLRAS